MNKKSITAVILLVTALLVASNCLTKLESLSKLHVVTSKIITAEGNSIYLLSDDTKGTVHLKKLSLNGDLNASLPLANTQGDLFIKQRIIDVCNDVVYILRYAYNMQTLEAEEVTIRGYDLKTGTNSLIYSENIDSEPFYCQRITSSSMSFGLIKKTGFEVTNITTEGTAHKTLEQFPLSNANEIAQLIASQAGETILSTRDSTIYNYGNQAHPLFRPPDNGVMISADMGTDGNIYVHSTANTGDLISSLTKVNPSTGEWQVLDTFQQIHEITVANSDTWVAIDANFNLLIKNNGDPYTIRQLKVPLRLLLEKSFVKTVLIKCLVSCVVLLLVNITFRMRRVPLLLKQAMLILFVFTFGWLTLNHFVGRSLRNVILDHNYDIMLVNAYDKAGAENALTHPNSFTGQPGQTFDFLYFTVKDGLVLVSNCGRLYRGMPIYFAQKRPAEPEIELMLQDGLPSRYEKYSDIGEGLWFCASVPLENDKGEVTGYIESSILSAHVDNTLTTTMRIFRRSMALILNVGAAIYLISLFLSLKPLAQLKKGAQAISNGNYHYRVHINTRDELGDIGNAFNTMSADVQEAIMHIEKTNQSYSRFVPSEMFAAINKSKVTDVNAGDCAEIEASLLLVSALDLEEYKGPDLFAVSNDYYSLLIPKIIENSGMIERYGEGRLVGLFQSDPSLALQAAIGIFESLAQSHNSIRCSAVVGFSKMMVGIIGGTGRLTATAIAARLYEAEQMGILGQHLGCSILLTDNAKNQLGEKFDNYSCRFLGYIQVREQLEPLYDVLDGDFTDLRFTKHDTKELFETAVSQYYNGEYYNARKGFIQVIKKSPQDMCAKEYLKLSDALYQQGGDVIPLWKI